MNIKTLNKGDKNMEDLMRWFFLIQMALVFLVSPLTISNPMHGFVVILVSGIILFSIYVVVTTIKDKKVEQR